MLVWVGRSSGSGLGDREKGACQNDAADQHREAEHASPSKRIDEKAADHRRDHRAERIEHRQVGDRLDETSRSVHVRRDGADQRHAACGADRLQRAAEDHHGDRVGEKRQHASEQEDAQTRQQQRPPAVPVRERAIDQGRERHEEQRDAETQLRLGIGQAKRGLHHRDDGKIQMNDHRPDQRDRGEDRSEQAALRGGCHSGARVGPVAARLWINPGGVASFQGRVRKKIAIVR